MDTSPSFLKSVDKLDYTTSDGFLAVGSDYPNNIKAELYGFGTGRWTAVSDYPYGCVSSHTPSVYRYDMVFIPEQKSYFVIGGHSHQSALSQIARFTDGTWYDAGQLNSVRRVSFCSFFWLLKKWSNYRHLTPSGSTTHWLSLVVGSRKLNTDYRVSRVITTMASSNVSTSRQHLLITSMAFHLLSSAISASEEKLLLLKTNQFFVTFNGCQSSQFCYPCLDYSS